MPRPLLLLALLACVHGCDSAPLEPLQRELLVQRSEWRKLGIADYDVDVRFLNMWYDEGWHRVEVRSGVVSRCVNLATDEEVTLEDRSCATVERLFARALELQSSDDDWMLTLEFDPTQAYIRALSGDVPEMADEEFTFLAENLVVR